MSKPGRKPNLYEYKGARYSMDELVQASGVPYATLCKRIHFRGWTLEQALSIPTPKQRRRGVVQNFGPFEGTGAGSTAQEIPEITFSEQASNP